MSKEISMEEKLWKSCNKLRGSVESADYKHIVLGLIFLKYAGDRFYQQQEKLISKGQEKFLDIPDFYTQDNVFFLPETARWNYIMDNAKQDDISMILDTAFRDIEKKNKQLEGALPSQYYSRVSLEKNKLSSLLDVINTINTVENEEEDILGRVYEYFLRQFAIKEGGEFYTPKSIVNLLAEIIEPYDGTIYDPCCGSGGMFVQSIKFVKNHQGNTRNVRVYGQESESTTRKLALMNLAIRGISANLGEKAANTFFNDLHKNFKFDYIMANPPFNLEWREENELVNDYRWNGFEVPPKGNANYAWILHMLSKLSEDGIAAFLLSNGSLNSTGVEYNIRKKLIEIGVIESIMVLPMKLFYSTNISVSLWVINKNKLQRIVEKNGNEINYRNRKNEVIFFDLRNMGSPIQKKFIELTKEDRDKVVKTIHNWQTEKFSTEYENIPEFCYAATIEEIREKDYELSPSQYIEFVDKDENINFEEEMSRLSIELEKLLKEEEESTKKLLEIMKELDYEIQI